MLRRRNDFSYSPFQGASETSEPGISRFRDWSFGPSRNDAACRMTSMKTPFTGLAVAAVLVIAPALPGYAEDAAAPRATPAPTTAQTPASAQPEAPLPSVPRPSLAPKTAEPASPPVAAEPARRPQRRYAHRYRRYGTYRAAYWEPFPIYWPHFYRSRIHWNRIPWFSF